jgi:hypothetical protein
MTTNGHEPDAVQPSPVPTSVNVQRTGTTVFNGETVNVVRVTVYTPSGQTVFFLPAPIATSFANLLRDAAGGLHIASTIEGLPHE